MASKQPKTELGKHRLIFAIFLVQLFIVLMFNCMPYIKGMLMYERQLNAAIIGKTSEIAIKDRADALFTAAFVNTGAYAATLQFVMSAVSAARPDTTVSPDNNALVVRMQSAWMIVWLALYRMIGALSWLLLVIPAGLALLIEALYFREIRKWKYILTSPTLLELSKGVSVFFWVGIVYGLVAPIPLPSWMIAIFAIMTLMSHRSRIINTEKRV